MPSKNDINPQTGQPWAVNPATGACETCGMSLASKRKRYDRVIKYCSRKCYFMGKRGKIMSNKGRPLSLEHRAKLSGENANAWRGGVSPANEIARKRVEYRLWRIAVFMRDDYTCQTCLDRGGELHADHIKPFAYYPELRYAIDNGRTLCVACHLKTDTYGGRVFKYAE